MNKKGMTLIELLVYMAIAALLLTPIIMLMQNSSLNMARDAVNTDLRISGRDILNIMYDDIRNTGFKLKNSSGEIDTNVFMSMEWDQSNPPKRIPKDPSSFQPYDNGVNVALDALTIRKGRLNPNGEWDGYDTVKYYVRMDTLIRSSTKFIKDTYPPQPDANETNKERKIASSVEALQFMYSAKLDTTWYYSWDWEDDIFDNTTIDGIANKKRVQYIKISVVTVDRKKLAPTKTFPETSVGNYTYGPITDSTGQYLREVSEIVVPIPNNGLFP